MMMRVATGTERMRSTLRAARRAHVAAWILVAVAGCAAGGGSPTHTAPQAGTATSGTTAQPAGDYRVLGAAEAPVTVIEFTDLQCPYCARFALTTWPQLRERYVDSGKVQFVSRDLPLSFHPYALPAAVASRCAGDQGRFWEYREALFRGQAQLANAPYAALAERLGLDVARFEACRADPALAAAVRDDAALAARNGIASTPTFVIGRVVDGQFQGEILSGAQPLETFAQKIDALLAEPARP
jgi:protein-disulfide isomerase